MSDDMKQCPFCAEYIKRDAMKCRYCGSMIDGSSAGTGNGGFRDIHWMRPLTGRVLGGVCAGIATEMNAPQLTLPFRLFFILTTLFWGFGLGLYLILWLLMPSEQRPPMPNAAVHLESPSQPSSYSPTPRPHSPLVIIFALVLGLAAILVLVNAFAHYMPWFHGFGDPRFIAPGISWHRISPFGGVLFPSRIPFLPILLVVTLLLILLLAAFKFFRIALGCFGVLLALIILVFLAPVLLPVIMVPMALLIPLLILTIPILLIIWILKLLIS